MGTLEFERYNQRQGRNTNAPERSQNFKQRRIRAAFRLELSQKASSDDFMKQIALVLLVGSAFYAFGEDKVDLQVVHRIKAEAFRNSKVMDHLFYLTDANGPRLTGSPGWESAANWVVGEMKKYGIENGHLESWGPFGRGWSFSRFEMQMEKPAFA